MVSLPKGYYRVRCPVCLVEGRIRVVPKSKATVSVSENIAHDEGCTNYRVPQPSHLGRRAPWRKHEKRANALVGTRPTAASGALNEDGDGRVLGKWRMEAKSTEKEVYTITQAVWEKLVLGALKSGEEPVLHIQTSAGSSVVLRADFAEGFLGDLGSGDLLPSRTYKVLPRAPTPGLVALKPPGVLLTEAEFTSIREALGNA